MENENDVADISNTAEDVAPEATEESVEEIKARLEKAEELANNYKIRAEKAERLAKATKVEKPDVVESKPIGMSPKDFVALTNAKVNEDDISEVEDYAKYKGISIAEALKSPTVKALLNEREETRKTANATSTGTSKRVSAPAMSDEKILENASKDILPDDADSLAKARMKARLKK